jgi:hypothetical protein
VPSDKEDQVFLNNGDVMFAVPGMTPDQLESMANMAEKGLPLPKGVRIQKAQAMHEAQAAQAPTPFQQAYQAAAGPATAVRDVATQGVSGALDKVAQANMAGIGWMTGASPEEQARSVQAIQPVTQHIAQAIVPQSLPQLAGALVLTAMGGPVISGVGVGGMLARSVLPAGAHALVEGIMEGKADAGLDSPEVYASILGGVAAEGVPGLIRTVSKFKVGQQVWDKIGDKWARDLGNSIAQNSSVKQFQNATPELFSQMMAGPKANKTKFHEAISDAIGKSEDQIAKQLPSAMSQLTPDQRHVALSLLGNAAGQPIQMGPIAHGVVGAPAPHGAMEPERLFNRAVREARRLFADADDLDGAARFDAMELYGAKRREIYTALTRVNQQLGDAYDGMNNQFSKDIDTRDILWRMKDAWGTGTSKRTSLDVSKVADVLMDEGKRLDKTEMLGGQAGARMYMAGKRETPGARPKSMEQYMRVFQGLPAVGTAASFAGQIPLMMMPQAPVSAAHVKALQDYLAAGVIKSMAGDEK